MLVLTRKQNEKIQIGDQITITVVKLKGKAVRLGIQAPPEMSVLRGELAFEIAGASDEESLGAAAPNSRARGRAGAKFAHAGASSKWEVGEDSPTREQEAVAASPCWSI